MKMSERKDNINDFDLMMKSILDEGREEVPAHIWEGVSIGLDKAAHKKSVVLWWRRAAVGTAIAAAVAVGVFLNHEDTGSLVPEVADKDMIAVVEPAEEPVQKPEEIFPHSYEMTAYAKPVEARSNTAEPEEDVIATTIPKTASDAMQISDTQQETEEKTSERKVVREEEDDNAEQVWIHEDWGDETVARKKRNVSLVLSGIAGTNNTEGQKGLDPMRRPSLNPAPEKTGIQETSTKASYGIPVSFGAGVKIGLGQKWSIGTGINYTLLSRQFYGKYIKVNDSGHIENMTSSDIRNTQHYVGIPVNVFYDIMSNDKISMYAYAGGSAEKCVSNGYSVLGTSVVHKEKIKGIQLSANTGIGVEFMISRHLGLYLDPSLRYYFDNGQPKSIRTVQPLMLGFEMGFRARL